MKISVIGTGYVGLITGACLAELGNQVHCLDIEEKRIDALNNGEVPFYEPGLPQLVEKNRLSNRLYFSSDVQESVKHGVIQIIAVGTPSAPSGSADLQYVFKAAQEIGKYMTDRKIVVSKSTVPVGTADKIKKIIQTQLKLRCRQFPFSVVSNPEFLKEGAAIEDFMHPDRIVIGCDNSPEDQYARKLLKQLYAPFNRNHERTFWTDVRSAEFIKYAANGMLATRISFMNELANLAEYVGVDIDAVRQGIGSDPRIGHSFLYAGCGYGGSCFPKDVSALRHTALEHGQKLLILEAVENANTNQKQLIGKKIVARFGEDLSGFHFAFWGLAFKPNTDDMREAPSRILLKELIERGASVAVFDPIAMSEARRFIKQDLQHISDALLRIRYGINPIDTLIHANALIILTEWQTFQSPDFELVRQVMNTPIIFDGRNLYDPELLSHAGFEYHGIGRPAYSNFMLS
jgi:UDPglucose 6-dehydrogenase